MGLTSSLTRDASGQTLRITSATWLDEGNATTANDTDEVMPLSTGAGADKVVVLRIEIPSRGELGIPDKAILKNIVLHLNKASAGLQQA